MLSLIHILVEEGDGIVVDCCEKLVYVEVGEEVLAERRKHWKAPKPKVTHGMLSLYAATARPSHEGGAMQNWDVVPK